MSNTDAVSQRLEALRQRLGRMLADLPMLGARLQFDLGADGGLLVDATRQPPVVTVDSGDAACTLSMRLDTLERIVAGELDGTTAFMQGEMTLSGDVELAVRLNDWLSRAPAGADGGPSG